MRCAAVGIVARMSDDAQVYRDLMRFKPEDLSPNAWAVQAGVSRTVWSDMRRHGNPSRRTLEKLLAVAGSSLAEFEALRTGGTPSVPGAAVGLAEGGAGWRPAQLPSLPLLVVVQVDELDEPGSGIPVMQIDMGTILDRLPRPAGVANDTQAFAITAVTRSMWPRFRPGRRLVVSPRAPVAIGDDVLVSLNGSETAVEGVAVLGELVSRTGGLVGLRQFDPDRSFSIDERRIGSIAKVMGELI
jgi:hypothetical protein